VYVPPAVAKRIARRSAQREHIPVGPFLRQMGQEAHFADLTSPKGAQGYAQFEPGTAASVGLKDPHDPNQAYAAAAKLMRQYIDQFGSERAALVAYNAGPGAVGHALPGETKGYLATILGGGSGGQGGLGAVGAAGGGGPLPSLVPQLDQAAFAKAQQGNLVANFLTHQPGQSTRTNPLFLSGLLSTQAPNPQDFMRNVLSFAPGGGGGSSSPSAGAGAPVAPRGGGVVHVAPGANRAGVGLQPILLKYVQDVAGLRAQPITITTGTNHDQMTVDGNVSDHWDGHAADIGVPVDSAEGDRIAMRALELAGVSPKHAADAARRGGLFTITPTSGPFKGHRIQVIWKTYQGGNHHNHVHVGVR
jgi:hypothetical protein